MSNSFIQYMIYKHFPKIIKFLKITMINRIVQSWANLWDQVSTVVFFSSNIPDSKVFFSLKLWNWLNFLITSLRVISSNYLLFYEKTNIHFRHMNNIITLCFFCVVHTFNHDDRIIIVMNADLRLKYSWYQC
jgi:hypothetical protein